MSAGTLGGPLALLLAIAGMVSALALFNALLMSYSRIPLVMAEDGLLPKALARTDARGTPRNAVLFSAVFYSVFSLVAFGRLVVADVLLYALALFLEFGALQFRRGGLLIATLSTVLYGGLVMSHAAANGWPASSVQ